MKRLTLLLICIVGLFFNSCENKWPANGYLDGMWQIMNIQHDGECVYSYDENNPPAENRDIHYISFQLKLFELTYRGNEHMFYGRFERNGGTLRLYQLSYNSRNETAADDNVLIPDSLIGNTIKPWGLYKSDNTFNIIKLTEDDMILQNDSASIVLRKF